MNSTARPSRPAATGRARSGPTSTSGAIPRRWRTRAAPAGQRGEHDRTGEAGPGPQRPALSLPLDQRQHQRGQRSDDQHRLDGVGPGRRDAGVRQQAGRGHHRGQADRQVDQEDRSPAGAGEVEVDQQPTDQLAGGGGDAHHGGVGAEGADALRTGVDVPDEREDGRRDRSSRRALYEPCGEQGVHVGRETAHGRAQHEQPDPEDEHPATTPAVADPARDEEQGAEGQAVAGDQPLEGRAVGIQVALHRRQGDVHDEEVQDDEEGAGQQDRERSAPEGFSGVHGSVLRPPAGGGSTPSPNRWTLPQGESAGWRHG